jgi:hypothetical protein
MAGALHARLLLDLAAGSALREAEGTLWRATVGCRSDDGCAAAIAHCASATPATTCVITDLGAATIPASRRYRVTARAASSTSYGTRALETVIVAGRPATWQRTSWRVPTDE